MCGGGAAPITVVLTVHQVCTSGENDRGPMNTSGPTYTAVYDMACDEHASSPDPLSQPMEELTMKEGQAQLEGFRGEWSAPQQHSLAHVVSRSGTSRYS
jgi:hypothetical protein